MLTRNFAACHPDRVVHAWGLCKQCAMAAYRKTEAFKQSQKRWRDKQENKKKVLAYQRSVKYGISPEEQEALLISQGGLCAVTGCGNVATHLDHCHDTGRVRGILCRGCNTALGHVNDNDQKLLGLIEYLYTH